MSGDLDGRCKGRAAGTRIARLFADASCQNANRRWLCLREGNQPRVRECGDKDGSGLGVVRSVVENANALLLNNKRLDWRQGYSAGVIQCLLTIVIIANRLVDL